MKQTFVYSGPGYPLDPKRESVRRWQKLEDMVWTGFNLLLHSKLPPQPEFLLFGSRAEGEAYIASLVRYAQRTRQEQPNQETRNTLSLTDVDNKQPPLDEDAAP